MTFHLLMTFREKKLNLGCFSKSLFGDPLGLQITFLIRFFETLRSSTHLSSVWIIIFPTKQVAKNSTEKSVVYFGKSEKVTKSRLLQDAIMRKNIYATR